MSNLAYQDEVWEEMLDGKIVAMSPRPVINHNVVAENITRIFGNFLRGKKCSAFGEADVYLTQKDRVIPDAMIVCNKDIIKTKGIYGAPDLIVEILSPGTVKNDRGYKKNLYEKCGVKEYWLVDINSYSIEVYLLKDGKYILDNIYSILPDYLIEDMTEEEKTAIIHKFTPSLFPDMTIVIEEVFEGMF
jgi:Uma2 family endonuclease